MLVLGLETLLTAEVSVLVSSWLEGPGNNTASSTVPAVVCLRRPGHPARQSARQCRRDGGSGGGRPRHGHERGTGDAGVGCRQPADPGRQGARPRPPRDHVVDAETTQRHANELLHALPAPARSPPQLNRVRRRHRSPAVGAAFYLYWLRYLQPKNRRATRRERKATKTLAIVLGEITSVNRAFTPASYLFTY